MAAPTPKEGHAMEPVGVGRRAVAVLIDSILLFIVGYLVAIGTGQTNEEGFNLKGGPAFLWLGIGLAYFIVMEATRGATLGKLAMRLKVVKQDGTPMDWQASIVRNVLRLIDGFLFYLVGAIVVWISKSRQRLGDMAAHTIVVSARAWAPLLLAALLAIGGSAESLAASPRYTDTVLSDSREGAAMTTFHHDTPKIYLRAKVADIPAGATVKGVWIAEKTKVAPPNYKIDEKEMKVVPMMDEVTYSLGKPNAGWPEGDYRVELFIAGKPMKKVKFRIAQ
jgi:uncharacterized RDD family membrane protein YckC